MPFAAMGRGRVDLDTLEESDLDYASDEAGLARLRARCKAAIAHFVGCRGEYIVNVRRAIHLGAVCKSRALGVYLPPDGAARWPTRFWWYYVCLLRPWVLRLQATVALAASAAVVWSEVTIGSGRDPDLSPFSLAVHALSTQREFLEQLVVALPLVYMCVCTYFSLFKLGNFGFYHMVRGGGGSLKNYYMRLSWTHMHPPSVTFHLRSLRALQVPRATWSYSLLLSGSLLARFAAPLCYNFLHVIRMNEYLRDGQQMVFIQKMGSAFKDVPILGQNFNTWFPIVLVFWVLVLTFNLWESCASKFFIPQTVRFNVVRG